MTATKRKPAPKPAPPKRDDAARMHAEAMAAPLLPALSRDAALALAAASPGGAMAILEPLAAQYEACQPVTLADCDALTAGWLDEARKAALGPLNAWLNVTMPDPPPAVVLTFTPDLPAAQEAALERFRAAHDAQDAEDAPGEATAVIPVTVAETETFAAVTDEDAS
jgi:hypothetical protein